MEFLTINGHVITLAHIIRNYLIVEDSRITFRDGDKIVTLLFDHREIFQMGPDKVPDAFFCLCLRVKTIFEASVWFVGRDYKILFNGCRCCNRFEAALFFIEGRNVCYDESGFSKGCLNTIPDRCLGIRKLNSHPSSRLKNSICLLKTSCHQVAIFSSPFTLNRIFNCFRFIISPDF